MFDWLYGFSSIEENNNVFFTEESALIFFKEFWKSHIKGNNIIDGIVTVIISSSYQFSPQVSLILELYYKSNMQL